MTKIQPAPGRPKSDGSSVREPKASPTPPMSYEAFVARVEEVTGRPGRGSSFHCPAREHEDQRPSLSIDRGSNGHPVVFRCHAGCSFQDVLAGLGITPAEFYGDESTIGVKAASRPARRVAHYVYPDQDGQPTLRKVRWGPKSFSWEHLDGETWRKGMAGRSPQLYHAERLPQAIASNQIVFLVEGERDVESLERLGLVATTGHSSGPLTEQQARQLEGADVAIIPDNDGSGREQGRKRWASLEALAGQLTWLALPVEKEGGDVSDWIEAGGTQAALLQLVEAARGTEPPPAPRDEQNRDDDGLPFPKVDIELTDRGISIWSQEHCGRNIRYNVDRKLFMRWEDHRWALDPGESVVDEALVAARDHLKSLIIPRRVFARTNDLDGLESEIEALAKCERRLGMAVGVNAVTTCWRRLRACQVFEKDLDPGIHQTLVPGGILVDLDGNRRPARQEDLCTKRLGIPWSEGDAVRWVEFLDRITGGDQELANYIECALGYSIYSGSTSEQVFFFAWGEGSNGKSTLMNVARGVAGDYGFALPKNALTIAGQQSAAPYIAMLPGRRLVTVEEVVAARLDESLVKQLTGGDPIVTRNVYERAFEFVPHCKLWMCGNKKPRIIGTDHGMWRRVRLIPFLQRLDGGDQPVIRDYHEVLLRKEGPRIAARLFQGAQIVHRYGLPACAAVERATREYREEEDYFGRFFDDCLVDDPDGAISTKKLVELHKKWAEDHGYERLNSSSHALGAELRSRGYEPVRHVLNDRNRRGWKGLREDTH